MSLELFVVHSSSNWCTWQWLSNVRSEKFLYTTDDISFHPQTGICCNCHFGLECSME